MDPYSQYWENQVKTATPGKLLLMTFDAAIRFSRTAQEAMKAQQLDEQSTNIRKIQNILLELMGSLDHKVDSQLADNLDALYTYMFDLLTDANIHDNAPALEEVVRMLTDLRSAWADAELSVRSGSSPTAQNGALAA
jgi:flagellar secretion chaperone FliS